MDRRSFLIGSAAVGLGFAGFGSRLSLSGEKLSRNYANNRDGGYGPLFPKKASNDGETYLSLPERFEYVVFGKEGTKMSDGLITPGRHDGMAAFQVEGKIRLVRNHEVSGRPTKSVGPPKQSYDAVAGGGTTTLEIDPESRELLRDWLSLSGTLVNCAGGPTPWGSWISCEETCEGPTKYENSGGFEKNHGYNFEVSVFSEGPVEPIPLKAMGRFVHEAIAVDPTSGVVYQTEDRGTAGFYRFIPHRPGQLAQGGKLQMACVKGKHGYDTRRGQKVGEVFDIEWVDIDDVDPQDAQQRPLAIYQEGIEKGGATFARLEGCWYGNGSIYLNATNGGDARLGQIFKYTPVGNARGELVLLFESGDPKVMNSPDNLCVSPKGALAICEDADTDVHIRGLTREGTVFDFAKNLLNDSEFAGSCFSPDGETLFVNIQTPGLTFAIWGDWSRGAF